MNDWPATVPVSVRGEVAVFAATVNMTEPGPEPPALWNVSPELPLAAVQEQPAGVVTVTLPLLPLLAALTLPGLIDVVQVTTVPGTVN